MRLTRLQALKLVYVLRAEGAAITDERAAHGTRQWDTRRREVTLYFAAADALEAGEALTQRAEDG